MITATFATQPNDLCGSSAACLRSDIVRALMTPQEAIVEFAGRTCYRSVDKMGHAPKFLHARMAEGHQDIFEHVWITAVLIDDDDSVNLIESHRYAWVTRTENGKWCYVSANMRVWLELARTIRVARNVVARYLPGMFVGYQVELLAPSARVEMPERIALLCYMDLAHYDCNDISDIGRAAYMLYTVPPPPVVVVPIKLKTKTAGRTS